MQSFATEFPVVHRHSLSDFQLAVKEWIIGSPHTKMRAEDLSGIEAHGEWSVRRGNERIEILSVAASSQEAAGARYSRVDGSLEWQTSIVFSRSQTDSWVGVRVACESSHPAARLPPAKKPVVVRTLLERLGGAADGPLAVSENPHRLENVDIDLAARLIAGRAACRLPIVYVSSDARGEHLVDSDRLARDLSGMAHVVVEPNRPFSLRLKIDVDSQNVYGGTIGIYWPDGAGRRAFFIGGAYDTRADLHLAITDEVRSALANRRPLDRCSFAIVQGIVSRAAFDALKAAGSLELDKYMTEFDKELKSKEEQLDGAEREIGRLRAEVRKLEARVPMGSGLVLRTGTEQDFYPGELAGIVRDALETAVQGVPEDSRRAHVLSAIVEANEGSGEAARMRDELKELLKGSTGMDAKIRRGLQELGFSVSEDGKHYKVVFHGDDRYTYAMSKTGSDVRAGRNAALKMAQLFL